MRIGKLELFKKKEPVVNPPQTSEVISYSTMYGMSDFARYNPDDLIGRKGFQIYKKMMTDEQVKAATRFRRNSVTARGWAFKFDDVETLSEEEQQLRIEVMKKAVTSMPGKFRDALNGIMSSMHNGFSLSEKTFRAFEHNKTPYWGIKSIRLKPFDTFLFNADEYGELKEVVQDVDSSHRKINMNRMIHHVHNSEVDYFYGQSELREAYRSYYSKDVLIKLENIFLERSAGGFTWAAPNGEAQIVKGSQQEADLKKAMKSIQTISSVIMPKGVDLNVEMPKDTKAFDRAIAKHNQGISKALLMPSLLGLTDQGSTGSFAQSQTQLEGFLWMLDSEAEDLAETLNEQLFKPLCDYNFGDGIYPKFYFKPLSKSVLSQVVNTWSDLVQKGAVKSSPEDEKHIRDILDLPPSPEQEEGAGNVNQSTALNGAQTSALVDIVSRVGLEELNEESAIEIIISSFPIDRKQAEQMIASAKKIPKKVEPAVTPPIIPDAPVGDPAVDAEGKTQKDGEPASPSSEPIKEETVRGTSVRIIEYDISKALYTRSIERVAFTEIDRSADIAEFQGVSQLSGVVQDVAEWAANYLRENQEMLEDAKLLKKFKLPTSAQSKLKKVSRGIVKNGWQIGMNNGKKELLKADQAKMSKVSFAALTEEKALEYFESKAFTMAGKLSDDSLAIIKNEVLNGIKYSKATDDVITAIYAALGKAGMLERSVVEDILGEALDVKNTTARLNTTVRTTTFEAMNEARFSLFTGDDVEGFVTKLGYSSILDSRTSDICKALDGKVLLADASEWDKYRPPNHFNCRSLLIPITAADDEKIKPLDKKVTSGEVQPDEGFM